MLPYWGTIGVMEGLMNLKLFGALCLFGTIAIGGTAANADPIIVTLDYSVVFSGGTDVITGTVTFDAAAEKFNADITVTGTVDPGTYIENAGGVLVVGNPTSLGGTMGPLGPNLSGTFQGPFSSTTVFSAFEIDDFSHRPPQQFISTSVTNLAAAPVPGPIVGAGLPGLIAACGAAFGFWRRKRSALAA
jgi:hypothetical protein